MPLIAHALPFACLFASRIASPGKHFTECAEVPIDRIRRRLDLLRRSCGFHPGDAQIGSWHLERPRILAAQSLWVVFSRALVERRNAARAAYLAAKFLVAFLDKIDVPFRNRDLYQPICRNAFQDRLAAQSRVQCKVPRLIELVFFVVRRFAKAVAR